MKKKSKTTETLLLYMNKWSTSVNSFCVCVCAELQDSVMGLHPVKKKIYKTVSEKVQKQTKEL